jgi:hypothetical protein
MPKKYLLPSENNPTDHTPICVLSSWITNLKRLEETHQVVTKMAMKRQSNLVEWAHQQYKQKTFALNDHVLWFLKSRKTHTENF